MTPALEVRDAVVRFGGVEAVGGVSLVLPAGAIMGLVGPNGAGKTTLLDAVSGLVPMAAGQVLLGGIEVTGLRAHHRARLGLGRTFQGQELFADLTPYEHLQVAAEAAGSDPTSWAAAAAGPPGRGDPTSWAAAAAGPPGRGDPTSWAAAAAGLSAASGLAVHRLTVSERLAAGLGRALATVARCGSPVIVLDEPFAGLDSRARTALARSLRALGAQGVAVLVADHDLAVVMALCDTVTVLAHGRTIGQGPPATVASDPTVLAAYMGEAAAPAPPVPLGASRPGPGRAPTAGDAPFLRVRGLAAGYDGVTVVHGVDLEAGPGEIVALLGPNGAGKTTTLSAICGQVALGGGEVEVVGLRLPAVPHRLARHGLALVAQDRGVLDDLTVAENLRLVRGATAGSIDAAIDHFEALRPLMDRRAGKLSGGEQHLVALARALAARPRLLLVDELSLGLAPATAAQARTAVLEAAGAGAAVVVVDQHPALALSMADRAVVLNSGRVAWSGPAADLATDGPLLRRAYLGSDDIRE